jgi:23S rRNA (guanosine2251-2'-O)-methyltransferase
MQTLEGKQSVLAALRARQRRFQVVLIRHDAHAQKVQEVVELAGELGVPLRRVDSKELESLAHGISHGGVVAIATDKPRLTPEGLIELLDTPAPAPAVPGAPLLLLLEGVDDARNLGFTLRSAEALGAQAVLIKKHLWDFDPVEVARPSSGAYERLPLVQFEDVALLRQLQRRGLRIFGCVAGARRSMYEAKLSAGCVLAVGGEKRGLSGAVRSICDAFISIPTSAGPSSLSMSHASSILLAEAMRQRLASLSAAPSSAPQNINQSPAHADQLD